MRLLLVDDEAATRGLLERGSREEPFDVEAVADAAAAESRAVAGGFDAIVLDAMPPDRDGFSVCRRLRRRGVDTPILLLTQTRQVTVDHAAVVLSDTDFRLLRYTIAGERRSP